MAHRAERVAVLCLPPRPQPVVHRLALLVRLVELALGERGLQLAQHLQAKEPCVAAAVSGGGAVAAAAAGAACAPV